MKFVMDKKYLEYNENLIKNGCDKHRNCHECDFQNDCNTTHGSETPTWVLQCIESVGKGYLLTNSEIRILIKIYKNTMSHLKEHSFLKTKTREQMKNKNYSILMENLNNFGKIQLENYFSQISTSKAKDIFGVDRTQHLINVAIMYNLKHVKGGR